MVVTFVRISEVKRWRTMGSQTCLSERQTRTLFTPFVHEQKFPSSDKVVVLVHLTVVYVKQLITALYVLLYFAAHQCFTS